ncbi:hypothetical protein [Vibrio alfacsensis]|uniref:UrcA family protein n=1 Tax=Vibrio alfacsensis TaxID=1074311 RepID=A0ABM6Z053_9VIBR|nr:hypothetical protein [Vibrio alfacsensis]AXY03575.1 hypothetical protein D1115_22285 [Vibrio alfacsensis]BBM67425.1 hypothetical protein VA249_40710 [Vibrio alfacsensis]BCN26809.1 hypothetical protein VYA_40010 [Vibrio alfacsensis]
MKNIILVSTAVLAFTVSSVSHATDADQAIFSVTQLQSYASEHPIDNTENMTTDIICSARKGWEMAVTGLGSPEQCINDPNYLVMMREWSSMYTAIKYR